MQKAKWKKKIIHTHIHQGGKCEKHHSAYRMMLTENVLLANHIKFYMPENEISIFSKITYNFLPFFFVNDTTKLRTLESP